jgi:hypothetical protein
MQYKTITEDELDLACQRFVEREFPKTVKSVNRFSGKPLPKTEAKDSRDA